MCINKCVAVKLTDLTAKCWNRLKRAVDEGLESGEWKTPDDILA